MTRPAGRRPLAISAPAIELNDIHATRSPSLQPRSTNTLAARLARLLSVTKSRTSPLQMTAGFSGVDPAGFATEIEYIQGLMFSVVRGGAGRRRRRRPGP